MVISLSLNRGGLLGSIKGILRLREKDAKSTRHFRPTFGFLPNLPLHIHFPCSTMCIMIATDEQGNDQQLMK